MIQLNFAFCDYLPLKRTWLFVQEFLQTIISKCHWNWLAGSLEDQKKIIHCVFTLLPLSRRGRAPFSIWTNLNSLAQKWICTKPGYNWPSDSEEELKTARVYTQTTDDKEISFSTRVSYERHTKKLKNLMDVTFSKLNIQQLTLLN
jgi:hypothetical protein